MSTRIAGIVYVNVDGVPLQVKGNVVCSPGSFERESIVGLDSVHGYKEIPRVPFIECSITDTTDIDLNAIESLANVTVTAEMANGKRCLINNATQVNALELNPEESEVTVRFEGMSGSFL